ncbi:hypothetical protein A6U86_32405 [Rhizobium sp. AC27/96]|nr:hypothetical protein A6U86_32405 [Rhizobium sp. AC27/96]
MLLNCASLQQCQLSELAGEPAKVKLEGAKRSLNTLEANLLNELINRRQMVWVLKGCEPTTPLLQKS